MSTSKIKAPQIKASGVLEKTFTNGSCSVQMSELGIPNSAQRRLIVQPLYEGLTDIVMTVQNSYSSYWNIYIRVAGSVPANGSYKFNYIVV